MTRRKKTKSTASGNGAAAASAPGQAALAGVHQHDGSLRDTTGADVTFKAPTFSHTNYSLLGPRPVCPVAATRPAYLPSAPRTVHLQKGPRLVHASPGNRPMCEYPVTDPRSMTTSSVPLPVQPKQISQINHKASSELLLAKTSVGPRTVNSSCDRSIVSTSSTGSSGQREVVSSVISVSSTNNSDLKDSRAMTKPKQPYKAKVTYETEQIHIYPRQPILMVERLKNLEYHVGVLTEAVGRRPGVYPHGRGVRLVSETAAEYATLQRYLARIEAQEKIAWCSYSLPPGNSLKVNVKVRVTEGIKITDNLTKLKIKDKKSGGTSEKAEKDSDAKNVQSKQNRTKDVESTPKEKRVAISTNLPKENNNQHRIKATVNHISTSSFDLLDFKTKEKAKISAKHKLVEVPVQKGTKENVNTNTKNQGNKKDEAKKTTEADKTAPSFKTGQIEHDN